MSLISPAIVQTREEPLQPGLENSLTLKVMDYAHPQDVVRDDRLRPADKRSILSAWASDACAVESRPNFRWLRGTPGPVLVDHVLTALRDLDDMTGLPIPGHEAPAQSRLSGSVHGQGFARLAQRDAVTKGACR